MIEFGSEPLRWEMASLFLFIMSVDIPKLESFFNSLLRMKMFCPKREYKFYQKHYQNEDVISACPNALNIDQLFLETLSGTPLKISQRKKKIQGD